MLLAGLLLLGACSALRAPAAQPASAAILRAAPRVRAVPDPTFARSADAAVSTLEQQFYHAPGRWNVCIPNSCGTVARDWGADSLVDALFLRWHIAHDRTVIPIMNALVHGNIRYGRCQRGACRTWSDIPMWDAIAAARAFEVTGNRAALRQARRAFDVVDRSDAFGTGACPSINYQRPAGGSTALKTLETDSNYIKAALLLREFTGQASYLVKARAKYAAVRRYFLDRNVALYSVYVFDSGATCVQLPKRFFASVNGNMIDNGLRLAAQTGDSAYLRDALDTARAVNRYLSDPNGVYADLQADNDVTGPLVEAMYAVATEQHQAFARDWLITAAAAAQPARTGAYGRFFDGPAPAGPISAWSASGGLTLAIAAGALDPAGIRANSHYWTTGHFVADPIHGTPAAISFTGSAIALIGTIGELCCEAGHVRVLIDGNETFDNTGIWQNKSPAAHRLPDSVLLSWRWPHSGHHTIALAQAVPNAKEGGSFIHLRGYEVVP